MPVPPDYALAFERGGRPIIASDRIGQSPLALVKHDHLGPSLARRSRPRESGQPASTLADHALAALLGVGLELRLQGRELGKWRIRIGRFLAPFEAFDRRPIALALRPFRAMLAGTAVVAGVTY